MTIEPTHPSDWQDVAVSGRQVLASPFWKVLAMRLRSDQEHLQVHLDNYLLSSNVQMNVAGAVAGRIAQINHMFESVQSLIEEATQKGEG